MDSACATCGNKTQDYPSLLMCDDYFCCEICHLQKHVTA